MTFIFYINNLSVYYFCQNDELHFTCSISLYEYLVHGQVVTITQVIYFSTKISVFSCNSSHCVNEPNF